MGHQNVDKLIRGTVDRLEYGHNQTLQEAIEEEYGVQVSQKYCSVLKIMDEEIEYAPRGRPGISSKGKRETVKIRHVLHKAAPDGDVYMGVSLNQNKAKVVWDIAENNQIVRVEDTGLYEKYGRLFGWKKLKKIKISSLEEYEISDNLYEEITGQTRDGGTSDVDRDDPTPADEELLNVSASRRTRSQRKIKSDAVKSLLESGEGIDLNYSGYDNITQLILFPSNADAQISDYYWMFGAGDSQDYTQVAGANCNVKTYEYLKDAPGVHHADEYIRASEKYPIKTQEGTTTIEESGDRLLVHHVMSGTRDYFLNVADNAPQGIKRYYKENKTGRYRDAIEIPSDMLYAPVEASEIWRLKPALGEHNVPVISGQARLDNSISLTTSRVSSDTDLYAYIRLHNWPVDCPEMDTATSATKSFDNGGYEFIETLAGDSDEPQLPHSLRKT